MKIDPNNEKLYYTGRIDYTNPQEPVWVFPCTSVAFRFTGNVLKIKVRNKKAYWEGRLGYILDGEQSFFVLPDDGELEVEIPVRQKTVNETGANIPKINDADSDIHEFMLYKRQDACHEVTILGFEIGDGEKLLAPRERLDRRIEVYGDSVSAGEVSEALHCVGQGDPKHNGEYSNSWYSYPWILARKLGAELHDNAQGGLALMDNTGWFNMPKLIGLESIWDKICYNPTFQKTTFWDFKRYTPDICIVAVGQNDQNPENYMTFDYDGEKAVFWRERYKAFLMGLREKYPHAYIICCTTLLYHDDTWDRAIGQVVQECEDDKISQYLFNRNGKGTPGHLRIPEAEEMAEELYTYINTLGVWG